MPHTDTIDQATLEHLIEAGAVRSANIVGQPGGWEVVVQYGKTNRALAAKRGAVRLFRKFETLANYLKGMGLEQYQVDARGFDSQALKAERANAAASERLKSAHQAAAYKGWLTEQVESSIADPRPSVSHQEAMQGWEKERADLLKRVAKSAKTRT